MKNLIDLEKKINSELNTKINLRTPWAAGY